MFHCSDCHISFPSSALLVNHKQRFCRSSRVDQATQRLLHGDQPPPYPMPDVFRPPQPRHTLRSGGGSPSPQSPSPFDSVPYVYNNQQQHSAAALNVVPIPAEQRHPPHDAPDRPPHTQQQPYLSQPSPVSLFHPGTQMRTSGGVRNGGGGNGPDSASLQSLYQLIEQQQMQINALQGTPYPHNRSGFEYRQQLNRGHSFNHAEPVSTSPGGFVEGRFGIYIFAAEGLLSFHSIQDETSVRLGIKQLYCRRRIGNYLPELEQRDEWTAEHSRHVTAKRRDGYVNFGKAKYVFNVISANEVVLVLELLSKGRLVAWAEVVMDSLGDKVRRLRHPPVDIAGALRDVNLRATSATIGIELFRGGWTDSDDEVPEKPRTPPPKPVEAPKADGVGEHCVFSVDQINGVPHNVLLSRLVIFVVKDVVSGEGMQNPQAFVIQDANSPCTSPKFSLEESAALTSQSAIVVILEVIDSKRRARFALAHAVIKVPSTMKPGVFSCKLRRGPPIDGQLMPPEDPRDMVLCSEVHYRINAVRPKAYPRVPMSEFELQMVEERGRLPEMTPQQYEMNPAQFQSMFRQPRVPDLFDWSYLTPFNPQHGLFMRVEEISGLQNHKAMFKIALKVGPQFAFTRQVNLNSDCGEPVFDDPPFLFNGLNHDVNEVAVFTLYEIKGLDSKKPSSKPVAWGVSKLFLPPNVARNGRFTIPLFSGEPPAQFLQQLQTLMLEGVMMEWLNRNINKIEYFEYTTLTFAQGDPRRIPEFCDDIMTLQDARPILIPESVRDKFKAQKETARTGIAVGKLMGHVPWPEAQEMANNHMMQQYSYLR